MVVKLNKSLFYNRMNKRRKLKLCFIGDISSVHCKRWANYFVDKGHEVHFVDDHHYSYKNLKLHYLKNYTRIKAIDYFIRLIVATHVIRKIKPDLVHSQQITYHGFLGALSNIQPFIITPWGSDILSVYEGSLVYKYITKYVLHRADFIHIIDRDGIKRVIYIYKNTKKKAFILNEGVDTKIYKKWEKTKAKNKVRILSIRAPLESYNTILFVEALNIVVNEYEYKNIEGIMCNRGDHITRYPYYEEKIMKLVDRYGLREYMRFFRYVRKINYSQKFMKNADIYVDTMSRNIVGQGTGKTALEAMSSELSVVLPDNPDIKPYIKNMNNGIIYKKNNARSLANAIAILIKDDKLRKKLGKNARRLILENLDWNKNMKLMEQKYYEIVNKI